MKDHDSKCVSWLPLIDGALLWPNPAHAAQMAIELVRLDATRTEADAIKALVDNGRFGSTQASA